MLESATLPSLRQLSVPARYDVFLNVGGLQLRRLLHAPRILDASFAAFKSRGETCRRILATLGAGEKIVIELASFSNSYETDITGVIRARQAKCLGRSPPA